MSSVSANRRTSTLEGAPLPAALAERLRCPACMGEHWGWSRFAEEAGSGTLGCARCGGDWLVVEGVAMMTAPVASAAHHRSLAAMLREDPETRTLVSRSLGRFEAGLGGVEAALSHARRGSLEDAFRVPGAPWISLSRFGWPKYDRLRELVPVGGVVLDLGCGFGPSLAPFLSPAKGGAGIGLDENLLFLLLFKRFAAERELREPVLVCRDAGRAPLPLADAAADVVIGASFFNHFACLRPRRKLRHFFAEAARVTAPGGTLILDMVPNRHRPFPTEVNVGEVIHGPALRRRAERLLRRLPTRWLPGPITAAALWVSYRLYMALARRRALGLTAFKRELGKAVPEAALSGLPYRLRQYARLAAGFSAVELLDDRRLLERRERVPVTGFSPRIGYLVLRARR